MDTKKIIILASLLALVIVLSFISFNNARQIIIKAPLYDVAKQINDLNNWKKWYVDLQNDDVNVSGKFNTDQTLKTEFYTYTLHHITPVAILITKKKSVTTLSSSIELIPINDSTTSVSWKERLNFFEMIKRSINTRHSRKTNLDNLKKLMEDPNNKYGFFIKIVPVKDILILTAETKLIDNTSTHTVAFLYNQLETFIKENNLRSEKNYFYTTQLSDNKIAVGIPVYKQVKNTENIKFLQLPGNGRLVEGIYTGKVADKRSIYNAINSFMLDQHLKQVAQPLEQYNVADTVLNNNEDVNLKIYYPVF